ncbi:dynamin family protein [Nostoc sp. LEGE 06077]|uniref:dynamin family protein n=1 Tax=Nostoc sp. LEGE 06077 TaxID=915325 RepID=UPI00187F6B5A|nr:dynamin family protein [Nostoc sp. LEGE 06077]MBE9210025.1 dynamin family protein [Nostoc sp. LEGE 06077]
MSSEQFQAAHDSIYNTGKRLLEYLQEIRQGRLSEGDDTRGLQSIEDDIQTALNALKEQKYQVAVIAAMKAGKSTFLNAVIGADILASEVAACTICRTNVRHIPLEQTPRLLEYREGHRNPFIIAEGDAGEIQQKFLLRTREIREKGNTEKAIRFQLEHPIEAVSQFSSLTGFTLVDTPGPNEWESAHFNTVTLKQTALEVLRTCNAILFILDYTSYRDNAISDLFKDVVENRKEILTGNTDKIYFILNKVDQKTEKDKTIDDVINELKRELTNFGFPNPVIYPASSRQGILAKLIQQGKATESQIKDFKTFFSARYSKEDEEGNQIIPAPWKIAPQALRDSGLPIIQETVIQTITQNAGWNLLSDVLSILFKASRAIEDSINTQRSGWEIEIESLKLKLEEYRVRAESTKQKVEDVKKSVEEQKRILIKGFKQAICIFADVAKAKIQNEIDYIAQSRSANALQNIPQILNIQEVKSENWGGIILEFGEGILEAFPSLRGLSKIFKLGFQVGESLLNSLNKSLPEYLDSRDSYVEIGQTKVADPYKIRVKSRKDAETIKLTINQFCTPHVQSLWFDIQDKLVREGTDIRKKLLRTTEKDIQEISNELSKYIGDTLDVKLNINSIKFPSFKFKGIDAAIQHQQDVIIGHTRQKISGNCCKPDYCVDVPITGNVYDIDLKETARLIQEKIDAQVSRNQQILERVIDKQVSKDFSSAEQQINDYIKRFQDEFYQLLKERATRELEKEQILAKLESQKTNLNIYLSDLAFLQASLNSWKPAKIEE